MTSLAGPYSLPQRGIGHQRLRPRRGRLRRPRGGAPRGTQIAASFHEGVRGGIRDRRAPAPLTRQEPWSFSGGSFQNLRLLASLRDRCWKPEGFRVLTHRLVPPNDGGVSYGQAAVAAATAGAA